MAQTPGVGSMEGVQEVDKLWSSETLGRGVDVVAGQPFGLFSMAVEDADLRKSYIETQIFTNPSCFFALGSKHRKNPIKRVSFSKTRTLDPEHLMRLMDKILHHSV